MEQCYYKEEGDYFSAVDEAVSNDADAAMKNLNAHLPRVGAFHEIYVLYQQGEYEYPIQFLTAENIDTVWIELNGQKSLDDIHKNKRSEFPGVITIMEQSGNIKKEALKAIYGHGNDSWSAQKKSYNLKLENRSDLFGMGENEDFVLLAGYRDDSLMSYVTTTSRNLKCILEPFLDL